MPLDLTSFELDVGGRVVGLAEDDPVRDLATLTLVNDGDAPMAAGSVSPIFGWCFKMGDVPAGTAPMFVNKAVALNLALHATTSITPPILAFKKGDVAAGTAAQFQISSAVQPYSWGCQSYYSDGSLCYAMFMLRTTATIAGNGSQPLGVFNGGTAPAPSNRTLAEVYALGLRVNMTGAPISGANLSGTWISFLDDPAVDVNNVAQYVYVDGQAGKVWRIETEIAQSVGGPPHRQLYCYNYIAALQNNSGTLGGFRHVAKIAQPWYNVDSPPKNWIAFVPSSMTVTWTGGSGGTNTLPWPVSPVVVTGSNSSQFYTTPSGQATQYYVGAGFGSDNPDWNVTPGYFTSSTDSALSTTQIYFALGGPSIGANALVFRQAPNSDGLTISAGGTATFNPVPLCLTFGAIWTLNTKAQWAFMQGAGSFAADATIRTQMDAAYFHSTGLLPPLDMSLVGSVNDRNATFLASYPNWSPISGGPIQAFVGAPGAGPYIGAVTAWAAAHFLGNQTVAGEQVNRQIAYASSFSVSCFRDRTTRNIPNLSNTTYSGMTSATALWWVADTSPPVSNGVSGFTAPYFQNTNMLWIENNTSHKPPFVYYTYLVFGGPDILDLLLEQATSDALNFAPNLSLGYARNYVGGDAAGVPGAPLYNVCTVTGRAAAARSMAWTARDWFQLANVIPHDPTNAGHLYPDGSAVGKYVVDQANGMLNFPYTCLHNNIPNAYAATVGFWNMPLSYSPTVYTASEGGDGFFDQYFAMTMALGAVSRLRNANAACWVSLWSSWRTRIYKLWGGWHMYTDSDRPGDSPFVGGFGAMAGLTPISLDSHWAIAVNTNTFCLWTWQSSSNPYFTFALSILPTGLTPSNGDKWMFDPEGVTQSGGPGVPGSNFSYNTPYYTRDTVVSGGNVTFNLAAAPTGSPDWQSGHPYQANAFIQPTVNNAGNYVHQLTAPLSIAAGTSSAGPITWTQTVGGTTTDGPLTWTNIGTTAVIVPTGTGTTLGAGFQEIGGPWPIFANPPAASTGATPFSNTGPDGSEDYLMLGHAADCTMAAAMAFLGITPPAGFTGATNSATVTGDSQQRISVALGLGLTFANEAMWKMQTTF